MRILFRSGFLLGAAALLAGADTRPGYLDTTVDLTGIVPAAPVKGEARYDADRKVFKATRRQVGSARYILATSDAPSSVPAVMADFSCAAGVTLSPERTPATYRLLLNANADTARANNAAKEHWKRLRPFLIDKGRICDPDPRIGESYDYPSGHTTRGWTFGLILSDLEPDRMTPILVRARSYGESRIVCGVHNMSAVEAGRLGATVTMQAVRQSPAYQRDLVAARAELDAARRDPASAPDAGQCSAESALIARSVLEGLPR